MFHTGAFVGGAVYAGVLAGLICVLARWNVDNSLSVVFAGAVAGGQIAIAFDDIVARLTRRVNESIGPRNGKKFKNGFKRGVVNALFVCTCLSPPAVAAGSCLLGSLLTALSLGMDGSEAAYEFAASYIGPASWFLGVFMHAVVLLLIIGAVIAMIWVVIALAFRKFRNTSAA